MNVFNKREVADHFKRSIASYDDNAIAQKMIVDKLFQILESFHLDYTPKKILEIGCGTGILTARLRKLFPDSELSINDLVEELCVYTTKKLQIVDRYLAGDIEQIDLCDKYDLIISSSTFQWFTHPESTFKKLYRHMSANSIMLFSTFGKENLSEIRILQGSGLHYLTSEETTQILSKYFEVHYYGEEYLRLEFDDPLAVLQHLKMTGVNGIGKRKIWTKGKLEKFVHEYSRLHTINGKVQLTYHPLYFICRKLR